MPGPTARAAPPTPTPSPTVDTAWAARTAYTTGDKVGHGGAAYLCIQGHTSRPGWEPPNVPALWRKL